MLLSNRAFHLFDEMFKDPFFNHPFEAIDTVSSMKTDIQEKDGNYILDIELPGFDKEDIKAELNNGYLTICATHSQESQEENKENNYLHRERVIGTCKRSFYVGDSLKQEDIKAGFKNGILRLMMPKETPAAAQNQPKLIEIK